MTIELKDSGLLKTQAYIDGQWVDADNGDSFAVINPATGEKLADVASVGATETARAIATAEQAMIEWKALPAKSRSEILERWYNLLLEHRLEERELIKHLEEHGYTVDEDGNVVLLGGGAIPDDDEVTVVDSDEEVTVLHTTDAARQAAAQAAAQQQAASARQPGDSVAEEGEGEE